MSSHNETHVPTLSSPREPLNEFGEDESGDNLVWKESQTTTRLSLGSPKSKVTAAATSSLSPSQSPRLSFEINEFGEDESGEGLSWNDAPKPKVIPSLSKLGVAAAPKCVCCGKAVYAAEKIRAIDSVWHKSCFTCGGGNSANKGCKKTLTLDNYVDHNNSPYCKACHGSLFGPKGIGFGLSGGTLNTFPPSHSNEEKKEEKETNRDSESSKRNNPSSSVPGNSQPSKPARFVAPPSSVEANGGVSKLGGGNPKCTSCGKSVYFAEKLQAIDRVWHKSCFTCGGTNSENLGCRKTLSLDGYLTHCEQPFCKSCHCSLFGPKGYGFGISASALNAYPTSAKENSNNNSSNAN